MADRIIENPDLVVDELKRKARRRLVGAIVIALAAAIILPLLLEKEPRPLGDDVSVQIPPVDGGKFVNRLTGKGGDSKALPKADDKAEPRVSAARAEPKAQPIGEAASTPATAAPVPPASSEPGAPKKSVAEVEQRVLAPPAKADGRPAAVPAPKAEPAPAAVEPKAASAPVETPSVAPSAAPAKADGFVVQLAAFADDKGANSLANRLKKLGYAAYVEPVSTSRGTLWRVRVGGYGSRAEADAARVKLKGEGHNGIVAPSK